MSFIRWAAARERENCRKIIDKQPTCEFTDTKYVHFYDEQWIHVIYPKDTALIKGYVISIHGGGLIAGCGEQNFNFANFIAKQGYVVFIPEYRLIPEVTFTDQLNDIIKAFNIIGREVSDYDARPIYLIGDSAGCHLALIVNAIGMDPAIEGAFEVENSHNLTFSGVWLNAPMIETTGFNKIGLFMAKHFYGKKWRKTPKAKYLKNPELLYPYLPVKTVLLTSTGDDLKKQAIRVWNDIMDINDVGPAIGFGLKNHEHDWNVMFPDYDDFTVEMNSWLLNCMVGIKTVRNDLGDLND